MLTRPGSGTYVAEPPRGHGPDNAAAADMSWQTVALGDRTVDANDLLGLLAPGDEGAIRLSGGYLHSSLQAARALGAALARAGRRPDAWEQPPVAGIAALTSRGPVAARLRAARAVADLFVARPLQEAALELVSAPGWKRHVAALAGSLRTRRDALVRALRAHFPQAALDRVPSGGLHLWVRLPDGADDTALAARAREYGVLVGAGSTFFSAEAPAPYLRLSYGATANTAELAEGVCRLARAWHHRP